MIPGAVSVLIAVLMTKGEIWSHVGINVLTPVAFEDLRQVTSTADCARTVVGWNISFGSCDPWHRPYNYPEVWARALAILNLGEAQASYIGYSLIVLFGVCMTALTLAVRRTNRGIPTLCIMTLAAISPPALFALERGNIDIVVFALTVLAGLAVACGAPSFAALLAGTASILKLFPLGSLAMILSVRQRRPEAVLVFVLTAGVGLFLTIPQLPYVLGGTPWTTMQSFGVAVVPLAVQGLTGQRADPSAARVVGLLIFSAALVVTQAVLRSRLQHRRTLQGYRSLVLALSSDDTARALVSGGGGCILVAYLGGTSWDYRLIFLIPVLAGLLRLRRTAGARVAAGITIVLLVANYWAGQVVEPWLGIGWFIIAPLLLSLVADVSCTVIAGPLLRARTFATSSVRSGYAPRATVSQAVRSTI